MDPPPGRVVFVDAGLPQCVGSPGAFLAHLKSLARGAVLPPWSEWFGPQVLETLVPDPEQRRAVVAELPRLPLSYFDARISVPDDWAATAGSYILLSEAYREDANAAAARGWPVI